MMVLSSACRTRTRQLATIATHVYPDNTAAQTTHVRAWMLQHICSKQQPHAVKEWFRVCAVLQVQQHSQIDPTTFLLLTCRLGKTAIVAACQLSCLQTGFLRRVRCLSLLSWVRASTLAAVLMLLLWRARNCKPGSCASASVLVILLLLHTSWVSVWLSAVSSCTLMSLLCEMLRLRRLGRAWMPLSCWRELKLTFRLVKVVRWDSPASDIKFCTDAQATSSRQSANMDQSGYRAPGCFCHTLKQYEMSSLIKGVLGRPARGRVGGQVMLSAAHCQSCMLVP
jgi:hypothetical protein